MTVPDRGDMSKQADTVAKSTIRGRLWIGWGVRVRI
jgi:hypothetical protein